MSETTSARLPLLSTFATTQVTAAAALDDERTTQSAAFIGFVQADGTGSVSQGGVDVITQHAMTLVTEWNEMALFVQIIHDALKAADVANGDGVTRFDGDLQPYVDAAASRYGVSWSDVVQSEEVDIDLRALREDLANGTIPPDSGFVNDPVCTATGHLLIDARDFVMPPRLDVLTFRRTYASIAMQDGAFGPGWWTWTECHNAVLDDGTFAFRGPDALSFELQPHGDGTFIGKPELDVRLVNPQPGTYVLHWGRRSHHPYQQWTFVDGHLIEVAGPFTGSSRFEYGPSGLSRIVHESGRRINLRWSGRRVVGLESSDGRTARFSYDRRGHLVGVENGVAPENYEVDAEGRILTITDADGVRLAANTYDELDRVVEQQLPAGFLTRFDYAKPGKTTLSDRDHNPLSVYSHDKHGRAEMYATGGGFRFNRRFDALGRVVSQQAADGTSFTLHDSYTSSGRTEEIRWSSGAVDRYTYDHRDRLVESATPERTTRFEYHDDTVLPSRIAVTGDEGLSMRLRWEHGTPVHLEDADGVVQTFDVRADGTIASSTNGYGATTRFDTYASGAASRIEHADGRVVVNERDDAGRLLVNVDPAGGRGELRYSAAGRLLSVTDPAGSVTTLEYDGAGTPSRVVSADGVATDFLFDDQQRPIGIRYANGDTVDLTLNEFGRPVAVDVAGNRWLTERDGAGRVTKQVDPTGQPTMQTYGEQVQWSEITDAAGATSRIEMDLASRVTSLKSETGETHAEYTATGLVRRQTTDGTTREFGYTPAGRVVSVIDDGLATECRYDSAGQLVGANAGRGWWMFDRDTFGRVTRRVSPAGREQRYRYDVLGNLVAIEVDGATWRYEYDPVGRVTATIDPTGRTKAFAYDAMGRMVESRDGAGVATSYEFDLRGRIAAMIDGAGGVVEYSHDPAGNLTSILDQLGRRTVVDRDGAGRHLTTRYLDRDGTALSPDPLAGMSRDDDATVDFGGVTPLARTESADGSATRWTLPSGGHVELERDADGLATQVTSPGFVRTFQRDMCGRVISVTDDRDDVRSITTLRRDGAGRVLEQSVDGLVTTYDYDDAGQLIRTTGPDGVDEWQYDEAGRLVLERTAAGERRFVYDRAHQLVSLVEDGDATTYEYDARGRRVRATGGRHDIVYVWGTERLEAVITDGAWTHLDFDDAGRLMRFGDDVVKWGDRDPVPEPEMVGDELVISIGASTFGAVVDDGAVEWRPFRVSDGWGDTGNADAAEPATPWHDFYGVAVDGVVWLGVRPYDVATRQFLAPDPLAPTPGGAGSASPYVYAFNDPINFFDPTGRQGQPISISDFNDMAERYSGPQWGNIAAMAITVVAVVAVVAVTVATGGLALGPMIAIGAATGLASGVAREGLESATNTGDGQFNGGPIVKDTLLGAAGGFLGGVGGRLAAPVASAFARTGVPVVVARGGATFVTEAGAGALEGVVGETYDVVVPQNVLGSDGQFNPSQIGVTAATNAVVGTAADGVVPRLPGLNGGANVPTNAAADPSTTPVNVSPAPDMPSPVGDSPAAGSPDTSNADAGDTTPPADAGDTTPPADAGDTTPPADAGDTTPSTDAGDTTPPADAGDTTPPADAGDTTPSTDAGDTTPSTDAGDTTLPADAGDTTPPTGDTTPSTDAGDTTPPTDGGDTTPPTGDTTPSTDAGDTTPPTDAGDTTPPTGDTTPSTDAGDTTPPTDAGDTTPPPGDTTPSSDAGDTTPSSDAGDTTLTDAGDTTPSSDAGDTTPSSDAGDTTPTDAGDTTPSSDAGDTTPTDAGDTTPSTDAGDTTPPTDAGDTTPPTGDTTPSTDAGDTTPPTDAGDTTPPTGDTTPPADAGDTTPSTDAGDTTPSTDAGDTTPPTDAGDTTPPTGDTTPSSDAGDTTPSSDAGDTTPTDAGDTTPSSDAGDTTPSSDAGDTTPTDAGDTTPSSDAGDTTPTDAGDTTPSSDAGDTTPSDAGDTTPTDAGDTTPTDAGDTTPSSDAGDTTPLDAGHTSPSDGGDTTPSTDAGDATPSTDAGGRNAGDADPTGAADDVAAAAVASAPVALGAADAPTAGAGAGSPPSRLDDLRADPRNTSVRTDAQGNTRIGRTFRNNEFEFTVGNDGYLRRVHFRISEQYSDLPPNRPTAESNAQRAAADRGRGSPHDQGGHGAGYQFSYTQGDINQFPQDANLNNGAYRRMENEIRDWTRHGYEVEGTVSVDRAGGGRPDSVQVDYVVSDPVTGDVLHYRTVEFENESGQTFDRLPNRDMAESPVLYEGRGDAPPAGATAADPSAAPEPATGRGAQPSTNGDQAPSSDGARPADGGPSVTSQQTAPEATAATNGDAGSRPSDDAAPTSSAVTSDGPVGSAPATGATLVDPTASGPDANGPQTAPSGQPANGIGSHHEMSATDSGTSASASDGGPSSGALTADAKPNPLDASPTTGGTVVETPSGTVVESPIGTHVDAPSATDVDFPTGSVVDTPSGTVVETPSGTVVETPSGTVVETPSGTVVETPTGTEVETPRGTVIETPSVTEVDTPTGTEVDTPTVTETDSPADSTDADSADPSGGTSRPADGDPRRIYNAGGVDHAAAYAPEQLTGAPTANDAVDRALSDTSVFADHGITPPWTRQDLLDVINTDTADLTPQQRDVLNVVRDRMPSPQPGEVVQKALRPEQVDQYLDNVNDGRGAPDTVGGSMTRAVDTAHLDIPVRLYDGLRLDYDGSTFQRMGETVQVIRFVPEDDAPLTIPRNSSMGGDGRYDRWSAPFTGNGFTAARTDVVPEFQGVSRMQEGAEMWELTTTGTQRLTAVLRDGLWVRVS